MTLLLTADQLRARPAVAHGSLAPLASGLRRELEPLVRTPLEVPTEKALLSRAGGRCDRDGTYLAYDPFDARHRCPRCGRELVGEAHDRFRLYWHQLWLAERTLHAALLGVLLDDAGCRTLATGLLDAYAAQYLRYPNRDNVLGPSRPFFSTYLESIWLLQLTIALDLLEAGVASATVRTPGGVVRERLIAPSAALIASYDEGTSNRQVWNNAALIAAGTMLGEPTMVERAVHGPSGLVEHLSDSLLADGSWYEGENYHLFAHRGLWYGVQMAEQGGHALPSALAARFRDGFAAPFRTLLPDLTYPSRRDSQYAVSVRQPRFAESCELGLARGDDERLIGVLARLYDPTVPRGETGRATSLADVERNMPPTGLTRADLSWRALLLARAELPPLEASPLTSDLLPAQGIAILRRDAGALYVALDYGHSGGGHGHPDRLNLLLADGDARWFDDPGTGSYVDPSLHWYRSTLAHTAPLVDGRSQQRVHGKLAAFEDSGSAGWVSAQAELLPGLFVVRSVALLEDYLVDLLQWQSDSTHELALPLHGVDIVDGHDTRLARDAAPITGGTASEDGFSFLQETTRIAAAPPIARILGGQASRRLSGWVATEDGTSWWSALTPDVPTRPLKRSSLLLARRTARSGSFVSVWSWRDAVADIAVHGDALTVTRRDGGRDSHSPVPGGWRVGRERPGVAATYVVLGGLVKSGDSSARASGRGGQAATPAAPLALPLTARLGEAHYRRSEQSWSEAGQPTASIAISREGDHTLSIEIEVAPSQRIFIPIAAENPFDNEPMAINGDGVQLYVVAGEATGGWLLVPRESSGEVDVRRVEGWGGNLALSARWKPSASGWSLSAQLVLPPGSKELSLDVIVNETAPGRARRRGQLVLSGAKGEFVYLRGDRHERGRLLRISLTDA